MTEKIIRYIDSDLAIIGGEIVGDLVRCKDCKYWNTIFDRSEAEHGLCQKQSQLVATKRDDYCSYGERKEKE